MGLGFTNPLGTGGVLDMCLCFGCGGVGGVGGEWVGGSNEGSKWTDRNGEICSKAINERICDWKGKIEDNDC